MVAENSGIMNWLWTKRKDLQSEYIKGLLTDVTVCEGMTCWIVSIDTAYRRIFRLNSAMRGLKRPALRAWLQGLASRKDCPTADGIYSSSDRVPDNGVKADSGALPHFPLSEFPGNRSSRGLNVALCSPFPFINSHHITTDPVDGERPTLPLC